MTDNVINTQGLSLRYPKSEPLVVKQVDMRVPQGSVYGFLGPNGAGKTSTIRMLLGLVRPTAGDFSVFGQSPRSNRAVLRRVGSLVEGPSVYPHLTGHENLVIVQKLLNLDPVRIPEVLEIVNLSHADNALVKTYSLGMKQRLALALALLPKPDLLILDEPTNGLDPAGIQEIRNLIRWLPQERGITVFLSSHLLGEVEQVATHIGIIHHGELIFQDTLASLNAQRREYIEVGAFNPQQAIKILQQAGYTTHVNGGNVHVDAKGREVASQINRILLEQNEAVFHLAIEQLTLEDIFLKMTQEVPDDSATNTTN